MSSPHRLKKRPAPWDGRALFANPFVRENGGHHLFQILPAIQPVTPQIAQSDKHHKNHGFPKANDQIYNAEHKSEERADHSATIRLKQLLPWDQIQEGSPPYSTRMRARSG